MKRFVLLGASNLTMGLPLIVPSLQKMAPGPCEVLAAAGFGRSYGDWSFFLYRSLPGIVDCGLWKQLTQRVAAENAERPGPSAAAPLSALLTDIGNDVLYGYSAAQIAGWVRECAGRLKNCGAETVLTLPPLASVRRISRWRFGFFRTLFFPRCRLSFSTILQRAEELTERLQQLTADMQLRIFDPPAEWYGFDPIHIRRSVCREAWQTLCSQWSQGTRQAQETQWLRETRWAEGAPLGWRKSTDRQLARQIRRASPEVMRRFGRLNITPQPVLRREKLTVSLF